MVVPCCGAWPCGLQREPEVVGRDGSHAGMSRATMLLFVSQSNEMPQVMSLKHSSSLSRYLALFKGLGGLGSARLMAGLELKGLFQPK